MSKNDRSFTPVVVSSNNREVFMESFFEKYGLHIAGIIHLYPKEAFALANSGAVIVDVRDEMEMNGKKFIVPYVIYIQTS